MCVVRPPQWLCQPQWCHSRRSMWLSSCLWHYWCYLCSKADTREMQRTTPQFHRPHQGIQFSHQREALASPQEGWMSEKNSSRSFSPFTMMPSWKDWMILMVKELVLWHWIDLDSNQNASSRPNRLNLIVFIHWKSGRWSGRQGHMPALPSSFPLMFGHSWSYAHCWPHLPS